MPRVSASEQGCAPLRYSLAHLARETGGELGAHAALCSLQTPHAHGSVGPCRHDVRRVTSYVGDN